MRASGFSVFMRSVSTLRAVARRNALRRAGVAWPEAARMAEQRLQRALAAAGCGIRLLRQYQFEPGQRTGSVVAVAAVAVQVTQSSTSDRTRCIDARWCRQKLLRQPAQHAASREGRQIDLTALRVGVWRERIAIRGQLQCREAQHRHRCTLVAGDAVAASGNAVAPVWRVGNSAPRFRPRGLDRRLSRRTSRHRTRSARIRRRAVRSSASRSARRNRIPSTTAYPVETPRRRHGSRQSWCRAAAGSSGACGFRPTTGDIAAKTRSRRPAPPRSSPAGRARSRSGAQATARSAPKVRQRPRSLQPPAKEQWHRISWPLR